MTRTAFETALAAGRLQVRVLWPSASTPHHSNVTKWYTVRRNGRTRTWKRDQARFEIPLKYGFRSYTTITDQQFNNGLVDQWFRIIPAQPDNWEQATVTEESPT